MKKTLLLLAITSILTSCFEVKKLDIPKELQQELDGSKAVVISEAEISGVAHEIGDSLFDGLGWSKDTSFYYGRNHIKIFGRQGMSSTNYEHFDALQYSFETDPKFKPQGIVNYKHTDSVAVYQNVKIIADSVLKMVEINVNLQEVNLRVVKQRRADRLKQKKN